MSVVAFGFASCGDASGDASGDEKKEGKKAEEMCKCLDAAKSEKEAQACAPGKSMEELEAMYNDCQGSDDSNDSKDGDDMEYWKIWTWTWIWTCQKCQTWIWIWTWIWTCQKCQTWIWTWICQKCQKSNIGSIYLSTKLIKTHSI